MSTKSGEGQQHGEFGRLIRYADDFVILCRRQEAARKSLKAVQALMKRLSLRLHPDKTRLVDAYQGKEGFDFLGFHFHKCASWRYPGTHYCLSWPSNGAMKRIRQKIKAVTADWRRLPFSLESVVAAINPIIRGWVNYFRVGNSSRKFSALDMYVFQRMALFRRRKHQLRTRNWPSEDYQRIVIFRAAGQVAWA